METGEALEVLSENHEVYFITTRPGKHAKQLTEDWLFGLGLSNPTVLIAGQDKNPILTGLQLEFLVDDRFDNVYKASTLKGLTTYMVDAPYNNGTEILGVKRVSSVMEALDDYLKGAK